MDNNYETKFKELYNTVLERVCMTQKEIRSLVQTTEHLIAEEVHWLVEGASQIILKYSNSMPWYRYTLSNMVLSDSDNLSDRTYDYESEGDYNSEEDSKVSEYDEDKLQDELEEEMLELIRDLRCYYKMVQ